MTLKVRSASEIQALLGERLRAQRLAQGLPQKELAEMAGLSLGALRKLEGSGQCSMETLIRTVQALGLVGELESLFVLRQQSIADMERAATVSARQRAPRRKKRKA